ncbi:Plug domain-containing protein [Chitinophaga sp. 180180018-2]|nr:Plug domain-containing protein [Chitinophaga sp. 212800010-3]
MILGQSQKRMCRACWRPWWGYILLCLLYCPVAAVAQTYQLSEKISLSLTGTNAAAVLEAVDKQTNFSFTYSKADCRAISIEKINWHMVPLQQVLTELKDRYHLQYLVVGGTISFSLSANTGTDQKKHAVSSSVLKGRVVDMETAQPLPGATVQLEGTSKGAAADTRGYYELKDVPAGKYTLLVSFIGYQHNQVPDIRVDSGRTTVYNVRLTAGKSLDAVVVTAGPHRLKAVSYSTEREIISEIRGANAVVSGISNELINKLADRNAAEIVKRMPGITVTDERFIVVRGMNARYNQTYLNGSLAPGTELYTHAFALDLLPSPIIDRILVYKSPTPDLFGDVTGGSVKIFTKNARPVRHFDVGVQVAGRSTTTFKNGATYDGGKLDWLGFDDGIRTHATGIRPASGQKDFSQQPLLQAFSPDLQTGNKRMGPDIQAFANYFDNFRLGTARLYNFTMVNYTREYRIQQVYRQTGNLYSLSFGDYGLTTDENKISRANQSIEKGRINIMENLLLKLNSRHSIEWKNFILNEGNKNTSIALSQPNMLPVQDSSQRLRNKEILESFEQRTLYSGSLTGTHTLDKRAQHSLQWGAGYNYYKQQVPDQRNIRFFGQQGLLAAAGSNGSSYRDVYLGMMNRSFITNNEENYYASLDYTFTPFSLLQLRAGTYQLFKNRRVDRRFFRVNRAGLEGIDPAGFGNLDPGIHDNFGKSDPNLLNFREEDLGRVWTNTYFRQDGTGLAIYDATQPTDSYVADEKCSAFYLMGDAQLLNRRLNLVGGLRVENDHQRLSAAVIDNGAFVPLLIKKPLIVWLPSLNATYTFADSALVIRAGYGKTINRPEFRELSPFSDYDFMNDVTITGNPTLVTAKIDNYDLRFEWYPRQQQEMISAGVFYKRLKNPIEQIRNDKSGAVSFMPTNISYWNADEASVLGVEAEIRKSLSFLPGSFFRQLSVMINGAWIRSRANKSMKGDSTGYTALYSTFKDRQLQGQAPYVLNAGLFYDNPGWGLKASATYNVSGPTIYAVSMVSTKEAHGSSDKDPNGNPTDQSFIRPNLLELPRQQLDIAVTQRLYRSLNMKVSIQNLLDQAVRIAEDHDYDNKYTPEKNTGIAKGSGGTFEGPLYKGDNIFRSYKPGRYLLFSFIYSF